ncbi:hypothetical protein [Kocuria marina]|uniref:hypothetical protein n=1 Tax=Kocuria marina TaxID=223184 RepID=UPI00345FC4C8
MSTIYTIACTDLYTLLARMKPATTKASDRLPVLERVRLSVDAFTMTAMATDRYRLFMDSAPVVSEEGTEGGERIARVFTLPATAADDFKRLGFAKAEHEHAKVEITAAEVTVSTDTARLTYPALGADYPQTGTLMAGALEKIAEGGTVETATAYNAEYLADFAKVRRAGGISKNAPLRVHQVPAGASNAQMVVTFEGTDFWALLMSVRIPEASAKTASEALSRAADLARTSKELATA